MIMAKKKRDMPEKVFIGPEQKRQPFIRIVLAVDARDENGVPVRFTRMRHHAEAAERGDSDFMIAYAPEVMLYQP